jgi:hypothetical protein
MSDPVPQTVGEILEFLLRNQAATQQQMQAQMDAFIVQWKTMMTSKPRRIEPPKYAGSINEDLELFLFQVEQFYADYDPSLRDTSPMFVSMVATFFEPTPMNVYRQFVSECESQGIVVTWPALKDRLRGRFTPPDFEFTLRERLCKLTQLASLHDYISEFMNILVQCKVPINPLDLRFYFQQGLRSETSQHLREHHPDNLDDTISIALRYDHGVAGGTNPVTTAEWMKTVTCHRCKKQGHTASSCPTV